MNKIGYILLLCTAFSCRPERHNILTDLEKADGWELLFDGATLNGWRDYNGTGLTAPWEVENGSLSAQGKGDDGNGYIVTQKQYENFELTFDWKIAKWGNSGVLYHVIERPQYDVPYVTGPEYQVIDLVDFPEESDDDQEVGADYGMYAADAVKTKPKDPGEWNTSRILFDNGHVEHWLNGEKIVEFEAWTDDWFQRKNRGKWKDAPEYGLLHKGHICLQDHGDRSWYRNLKIRELPRKQKEVNLFNGKDLSGWEIFGTEKWYVQDGLLICESGPDKEYGYLATREYYTDFDLSVEFKQEDNGNSGLFFRSCFFDDMYGWQVEVAPPGQDTGGIYGWDDWLAQIPDEKEHILRMGEWNTLRLVVKKDRVTTWLNGILMTDLTDEEIGKAQGRIALQIHDGGGIKVLWRNLILKQL
ncbi:MAG: DUF1080 domain-containing protein [Tannerellaceae bacterium]|nr:DUF1080 domain-containing protein [Tannerellaceae bacterium]